MRPNPDPSQGMLVPSFGRTIYTLLGSYSLDPDAELTDICPPETYDSILLQASYAAPASSVPLDTPWTKRALCSDTRTTSAALRLQTRTKYKTVDRKVRPVPSYMPDPAGQEFKPVIIPPLPPLSLNPPLLANFIPTARLTRERLDMILKTVPPGFLSDRELDLLVEVLRNRDQALAFEDAERGTFSDKYFPDYEIPLIEHTPWVQEPIRIPKAIESTVRDMLNTQIAAKKYEPSSASYRSRLFAVAKKGTDKIRLIQDVQELNKVTVRDAGLPPRLDDFAEGFVGCVIYGLADLFAGYDGRRLAIKSRPATTFSCLRKS
ncbi:hypothetical protein LshimejAT787_0602260 [Lyophyllum shimeji]|uniref:Reverse transcriptase n=1 Tax=Lyophyllum shimeji TaxID=47721 RepID=A0A9P3PP89_LYOSH|nr:hypothetical protein LshimejAT787_0602260 [Lyophyllum shimeji]